MQLYPCGGASHPTYDNNTPNPSRQPVEPCEGTLCTHEHNSRGPVRLVETCEHPRQGKADEDQASTKPPDNHFTRSRVQEVKDLRAEHSRIEKSSDFGVKLGFRQTLMGSPRKEAPLKQTTMPRQGGGVRSKRLFFGRAVQGYRVCRMTG